MAHARRKFIDLYQANKSTIAATAESIDDSLNRWAALTCYLDDPAPTN